MQYSESIYRDRWARSDLATSIDVLLLSDNPRKVAEVRSAIKGTATTLTYTSTFEDALSSLSAEHFDLLIVDRHLGGWLSPQACKALVVKAEPTPVVGLINDKCVLDLRDGIEAGLLGVYYTDQIDAHVMSRLSSRYGHLPGLGSARSEARDATA
jgi:DNA-binding NarL/FixJ family response regulator